jgi:uncharacterized membrane protein YfcA
VAGAESPKLYRVPLSSVLTVGVARPGRHARPDTVAARIGQPRVGGKLTGSARRRYMSGPHASDPASPIVTPGDAGVLFAASSVAGVINSIAGGGSLITFPVLVWLGRDPILANATNTVSLSPGSVAALHGFRAELVGLRPWIVRGTIPSLAGGVIGAMLLLRTPSPVFRSLVPYLIFFATALFALSEPLNAFAQRHHARAEGGGTPRMPRWTPILAYQLAVSVYGGYFGAGIGIMMLAGLGLAGFTAIHRTIALRNYYAILINGIAAIYFILFGPVSWPDAVVLTAGQVAGSLVGARVARGLSPATVRWVVVTIGVAMALSLLAHGT